MRAALLILASASACATTAASDPAPTGPIVLELFTSQGCSSCPPADRLLGRLADAGELEGRALAPLSFHVDYWNDLGWTDPYSQPAWTERQRRYASALRDRTYTPELVIGGAKGLVGSNTIAVTAAITSAARPALLPATATWRERTLEVTATAPAGADVLVAVWEERRSTQVPRGENAGSTLQNARVVRRLERVAAAGQRGSVTVQLDPAWRAVGAVAFAQRPDMAIVASAKLPR